jgi:ribonucleoside-diphosphate reductase alpha chain
MDDVLEKNLKNHALPEQAEVARNYRNIGIGIMGLADCLVKLGYKYGSDDAIGFSKNLMKFLFRESVKSSVALALDKGDYPKYKSCVWDSTIIKNAFTPEEIQELKNVNHLRNCSLLSIAPTGSIGTMLNVSTGCEPFFMLSYTRKTESLNGGEPSYYQVNLPIVEDYKKITEDVKLPDYFVTSQNLNWKDRIRMQAALQEFCDTAISSTVNLPEEATIEDVKNLYIEAWKQGLKGVTIFRNNCKRIGILTKESKKEESKEINSDSINELPRGFIVKADDNCIGLKRTLVTGCGTLHCEAFFHPETGELLETYLSKGSKGGCNNFMIGLSRMISLAARGGLGINAIIDQLNSCGVCPSYAVRHAVKKDTSIGSCCPVAVGNALKDMYKEVQERIQYCYESSFKSVNEETHELTEEYTECPECHQKGLTHVGGCDQCILCGFSKCN